ncbi:hemolymph lipopolysaccharide-binding protein-like isoform X1 [Neodiprion pinetum]|uniref:hemolymph lipopolysaccharide-binding protein-like isoform X1 n=2 Tax=Neodiprion pinetum TaxID=441929 RepID=UPI001EE0B1B7|nr:hemolymph lipopolysaccharide-binding protein-like isoform X1 [Neodiprion pinetum]
MSAVLSLIVFGQVYILGPASNIRPIVIESDYSTAIPAIDRTLNEQKPSQGNTNTMLIPEIDRRIEEIPSETDAKRSYNTPIFSSGLRSDALPALLNFTYIPNISLTKRNDYTYTPGIGAHKVHTEASSWSTAWTKCRDERAHLAVVNSRTESELIVSLLRKAGPTRGGNSPNHAHVGFHDLYADGQWVTIDGQSLFGAGFSEWQEGEPSYRDDGDEHCGSIHISDGKLNNQNCNFHLSSFVCELP